MACVTAGEPCATSPLGFSDATPRTRYSDVLAAVGIDRHAAFAAAKGDNRIQRPVGQAVFREIVSASRTTVIRCPNYGHGHGYRSFEAVARLTQRVREAGPSLACLPSLRFRNDARADESMSDDAVCPHAARIVRDTAGPQTEPLVYRHAAALRRELTRTPLAGVRGRDWRPRPFGRGLFSCLLSRIHG